MRVFNGLDVIVVTEFQLWKNLVLIIDTDTLSENTFNIEFGVLLFKVVNEQLESHRSTSLSQFLNDYEHTYSSIYRFLVFLKVVKVIEDWLTILIG